MVTLSRENRVILGFGAVALVLGFGVWSLTDLPFWVGLAVLVGVGVVLPQLVLGYPESA